MDRLKIDIANDYISALSVVSFFRTETDVETEIISKLTEKYKLKDILEVLDIPKSTYEYRLANLNRENPDWPLEKEIISIKENYPAYGYRRVKIELEKRGFHVNRKKVQRLIQKLDLQVKNASQNGPNNGGHLLTYLGNKRDLLEFVTEPLSEIKKELGKSKLVCADLFSGSGIVSRELKKHSSVLYVNDMEGYSKIINESYLTNKSEFNSVVFDEYLNSVNEAIAENPIEGIITKHYAPKDSNDIKTGERCFFTHENAVLIDSYRYYIEQLVPEDYRKYFLAELLIEASVHSNTAGHYKAFFKSLAEDKGKFGGEAENALKRITGPINIEEPVLPDAECEVKIFQKDANELAKELKGLDVVYLDPPYNEHPYASNYHILNTIVNNAIPDNISEVSGIPENWNRSRYNSTKTATEAIDELVFTLDSKYVLVSYSNEGIITPGELFLILKQYGEVKILSFDYASYKGSRSKVSKSVIEYLFVLKKQENE